MKRHFYLSLAFALGLISAFANNGDDSEVTLCSGATMTWEEYQMLRALRSNEYDLERLSPEEFIAFETSVMNNSEGAWSSVVNLPIAPAAAANMPDGRLILWSARDRLAFGGNLGRTYTAVFDPSTNTSQELLIQNTSHDMFCPGISALPDGRVLVSGGSSSNKSSVYDPFNGTWSAGGDMNIARGYHSSVTLASGAVMVIGGSWSGGVGGKDAEIWSEKTGWFSIPGLPVDVITDGINSSQPIQHDDYFPWLWVAPDGRVLHAGPSASMHWIDPTGVGSYTSAGQRGNDTYSISGTTVMYDIGKVLKTGGSGTFENDTPANDRCYVIDMNGSGNPQVTQVGDMAVSRVYHNSIVLPTGEVMAVGGIPIANAFSDQNSRLTPELWNPNTQQWTTLASMTVPRNYHSIGILMTDGRVFMGGGGLCGGCSTNHPDAEIFSPPYLFNNNGTLASRPVINSAPNTVSYSSNINVSTNAAISSFALVRMSAVTHSTNNEQRRIPLSATSLGGNQYQLAIGNRNLLPPGQYMLFAMNAAGTPSVAKVMRIGDDINDCTPQTGSNPGGSGLTANYFNNNDFTNPVLERVDPQINFNWGTGSPDASIGANTFSVRWEGDIQVPRNGTYSFYTNSDDGVRLWVDDRLMIDNWTLHGPTEDIGMITLDGGQAYNIRLEYFEETGGAVIELSWSGPGILKELIPAQYLFPLGSNGAPCANAGGDSDGDGICNNDDQCPDLNDNLIGTACDDGNPNTNNDVYVAASCACEGTPVLSGSCDDIGVTAGEGQVTITELDGAPISTVHIFSSSWVTQYTCAPCNATEVVPLAEGSYFVFVRYYNSSWIQTCERSETINITGSGGGGGAPCANAGGDSDGDGICNDDDQCPNLNDNLIGTACNDGNPNTINDVYVAASCACEGTPVSNGSCDDIGVTTGQGQVTITELDGSPISTVHIFTSNWVTQYTCAPCNATEVVPLAEGSYFVFVRYYNGSWVQTCERSETISITDSGGGGGGGGDPCANAGGDSDGDGVCDDNDNCVNDYNPGQEDSDNDNIGDACDAPPSGNGDCDDVTYTGSSNALTIAGLNTAPIATTLVLDASWTEVFSCNGDCNDTETINNLTPGTYFVKVTLRNANWTEICLKEAFVNVGSANPLIAAWTEQFYFTAHSSGASVDLAWVSNAEFINTAYVIERSSDGVNFEVLHEEQSISEALDPVRYQYKDWEPLAGTSYYRIKRIYRDGSHAYSPNRAIVRGEVDDAMLVFPNPATERIQVQLSEFAGKPANIQIQNLLGHTLLERELDNLPVAPLTFQVADLEAGVYAIRVKIEGRRQITKLFVVAKL
ncbi:MAG: PA14 domain-containing protein [Bacteroidota bacterium]